MTAALHGKTPTLFVVESRGLAVSRVEYLRVTEMQTPQACITRQQLDAVGREVAQWDPRLLDTSPNLTNVYSLSATLLFTASVDAGWRLNLPGETGQSLHRWDERRHEQQTNYDLLIRPTAIHEYLRGQATQTVERLVYGDSSPESASHNQCGRLIRHNEPAGLLCSDEYGLAGAPRRQTRRFLKALALPDWPEAPSEQEPSLETTEYPTTWRYNAAGEILGQTDAREHRQHFAFDIAGQLKTIHLQLKDDDAPRPILASQHYNAQGQIEAKTTGNGVLTTATFNPADGTLKELKATKGDTTCQHLTYDYDPIGNVTKISDHTHVRRYVANQVVDGARLFTYDSRYQLRTASGYESAGAGTQPGLPPLMSPIDLGTLSNYTQTFEYDTGGNLKKLTHTSPLPGQSHTVVMGIAEGSNRCLSWQKGNAPALDMNFDDGGNLLTLQPTGQTLQWTPRSQLQRVTQVSREEGDDDVECYAYCSKGNRLRKWQSAKASSVTHVREVRYLPGLEIRTLDDTEELHVCTLSIGSNNVRCLYWAKGEPSDVENRQLRYSHDDHLGSSMLELDQDARLISYEMYYAYGGTACWAARSAIEADYKTVRYSGKERDASGLYYYGQRYYSPWMGRWISADPAGTVDGLNLYAMVGNNPMRFVDRSGLGREEFYGQLSSRTASMLNTPKSNPPPAQMGKPHEQKAREDEHYKIFPDARFSKTVRKDVTAHAGFEFSNGNPADQVSATDLFNIVLPKKVSVEAIKGISLHKPRNLALGDDNPAHLGILKIDSAQFIPELSNQYRDAYNNKTFPVKISKAGTNETMDMSGVEYEANPLHPLTEALIRSHITQSNEYIPQSFGLPGFHAEVRALNLAALLVPNLADNLQHLIIATQKLQNVEAVSDFPACFNCANILVDGYEGGPGVNVLTGRTGLSHATWNKIVEEYPG